MTTDEQLDPERRIARYVESNPDADPVEVLGALELSPEWRDTVADALDEGENTTPEGGSPDTNPGCETDKTGSSPERTKEYRSEATRARSPEACAKIPDEGLRQSANTRPAGWNAVDFSTTDPDTYPPVLVDAEQWMVRGDDLPPYGREKAPYAPWGDEDGAKWGQESNRAPFDTAREWGDTDPRADGLAFIQTDADPFAFVDGDDVRCPETGEVHPAFLDVLDRLGATYADVSTSGSGVHAYYEGDLPNEQGQAVFEIDTEPWGGNEDPPTVEIYANKHVCVTTGDHVAGTPPDVRGWDADALEAVLDEYDALKETDPVEHDTDHDLGADLEDYDPDATDRDETTTDARDIALAVDRLSPSDLPLRTRQVDTDATGWEKWDPSTYRTSSGNDSLHRPPGEPVFHDHKHGEAFGVLSLFAAEQGILSKPWDRLAGSDWFDAVDAAREAGAPIPEYDPDDTEPAAPLPFGLLDALDDGARERALRKRGLEVPSTDEAREDLRDAVVRELRAGNTTVLDAPTALGKSHTVATEPWRQYADVTGEAPVVHLHPTRDARDEAAETTRSSSATGATLKGRNELCPVARGDHDPVDDPDAEDAPDVIVTIDGEPASDWFDRQCDGKGIPFSTAHALATERNDQGLEDLPCCDGEGAECPAVAQWNGLPRDDDGNPAVDVIHATHEFAYVPSLRAHTNVILDEQPDFTSDLTESGSAEAETARVRSMVNAYLRAIDAPVTTWEALVQLARFDDDGLDSDASKEQDALDDILGTDPPTEWYVDDRDAHALAPDLTRAIWNALRWEDPDANGRRGTKVLHEPPRFDAGDGDGFAGVWLSVVIDEDNTIRTVRATPDFTQARAVIGLDAHPSMPMWELNAAPGMVRDAVLDPTERRLWRRYERGLTVVQIGEASRPRSGEKAREWMNDERVRTVLDRLRDHYGEAFATAISPVQVEDPLRRHLKDVTGEEADTMHYGEEKSRNDFATERAGYCYGCMDPGDEMILDALAELKLEAEPATVETEAGEEKREKGRTFDGADADTAEAVLASVRENHVAQAAGRYARNPDDADSYATVFVHTDAVPAGFADLKVPGVEWLATDTQRAILEELTERPSATTREIADAVECTKEHVRETLQALEAEDLVVRHPSDGDHGADVYRDDGVEEALVDLGVEETTNNPLKDSSRWSLAVWDLHSTEHRKGGCPDAAHTGTTPVDGDDPPPDPGD